MLRVTIRELLLLTAFFAAGLAALKYAGDVVWIVLSNGVPVCLMVAAVVALAARGRSRTTASGFAACMGIYLTLLMFTEMAGRRHWVTDRLILRLHEAMLTRSWLNERTGQEFTYDPRGPESGLPNGHGGIREIQSPDEGRFKAVGHLLWALLFGYLGSRFAGWIYTRRRSEAATAGDEPSRPALPP